MVVFFNLTEYYYKIGHSKKVHHLSFRMLPLPYIASAICFYCMIVRPVPEADPNSLIFDHIIIPNTTLLSFPKKKKNIIYISLESLDTVVFHEKYGGCFDREIIPFMEDLALDKNNVHFSHLKSPNLGGMSIPPRLDFTLASAFGALCGVPYMGKNDRREHTDGFLNHFTCLSDILKEEGYITSATFGTGIGDFGYGHIFDFHQFQRIFSNRDIRRTSQWLEDKYTYEFFKNELKYLSSLNQSFMAFMCTLDTHEPGHICDLCPDTKSDAATRSIECADRQLKNFLDWAKNQRWYNNTVFLIYGDHISRDKNYKRMAKAHNYVKKSYNVILNSEMKTNRTHKRLFTVFDLLPTVLNAAGVKIKGNQLGMGVSLFSDLPTGLEKYEEKFEKSFNQISFWYDTVINHKSINCELDVPCISLSDYSLDTTYANFTA
ncbi:hypothetical protein TVAG_117340 [Trichomonas vaginalis G3]|uniref:Sulfatase N-terminal domain-containing protein n=1 Tax=Trichomonas vaginalis (strain ATCC PRA-98 / G3) TaxID=412133 RepID=A2E3S4_TRIV3|nr:lipoteichoic acid synthase family [Trichomonas vaginalis G3]EAY12712.1 hypothetical protein TVAG_117340 [Trichomonas vaginalis G3]KAI5517526.1 lipoteichoic acid synthase family [Trichomonas vaginalis G3]|eukprot:XP_001324935.1 hypothetical protein [Trichomonas vaginalis G3]